MDSPPVPLPRVKSPPWHMKLGMMRWKTEPFAFPEAPRPFSPVQRQRKFSAVLGTLSAKSSMTTRPALALPMRMSKKTLGFLAMADVL
nr:unnamed protein product [Digitaria exilis]